MALLILTVACAAVGGSSRAQTGYADDRFPHLFAPRDQRPRLFTIPPQSTRQAPVARTTQPAATEITRPPRERTGPSATAAAPGTAEVAPTTFVLVLGDNLAEWLAFGIERAFEDVPEIGVTDKSRLSSGLVRSEFYDWAKVIPEVLAQETKVDFIVMMIGSNDRQALRVDREAFEPRSERWREIYVQRVDAAMLALKARGVPVYWVGMPPLRGQRASADMAYLNDVYKERAARNGVTYVDVWNGFVDEQGQYSQFGPDFAGQIRRLRTADGVHFTSAGARKLALFVEQDLRRDLVGRITPAIPGAPAADRPRPPETGLPQPEAALPSLELEPPRPRPLMGPILPLAGNPTIPRPAVAGNPPPAPPVAAPRGLAGERPSISAQGAAAAVLVRGEEPPPAPGRVDDFRWPRGSIASSVPENATGQAAATASGPQTR
ncbi:SGNH/GDSL hydrolase family protein [Phreatobacter stygius]|uniref:SGNH/GDSL hydrolase family protein n=1 Tax=Phreatobacter stygius TaxID=1940610 RepID=UPI001476EF74|nr:SGNH family hydrolase [Phreatobacter stygius]